jgi:hypothetical protein
MSFKLLSSYASSSTLLSSTDTAMINSSRSVERDGLMRLLITTLASSAATTRLDLDLGMVHRASSSGMVMD